MALLIYSFILTAFIPLYLNPLSFQVHVPPSQKYLLPSSILCGFFLLFSPILLMSPQVLHHYLFLTFIYSSYSSKMLILFQVPPCTLWLVSKYPLITQPNTSPQPWGGLSLCRGIHLGVSPWPTHQFPQSSWILNIFGTLPFCQIG